MEPRIKREAPSITTDLRSDTVQVPSVIRNCSGIRIFGKRIKSLIFTTDIAIILNNDADAVIAVYPFTPHPAVIQSIANVSTIPILSGVGGGTTQGKRSANISLFSEAQGSLAVVVNAPTPIDTIKQIEETVDIPIVCTIVTEYMDIQ
ncbi:MAG: hydrolase, partial [Trichococcus flocculiformis]